MKITFFARADLPSYKEKAFDDFLLAEAEHKDGYIESSQKPEKQGRNIENILGEAQDSYFRGFYLDALKRYARVLSADINQISAWVGQVRILADIGRYDSAIYWADKACEFFDNETLLFFACHYLVIVAKILPNSGENPLEKRVVINSFHSSSLPILLEDEPKSIISFDSHLDVFFGGDREFLKAVFDLPLLIRGAILRSNIHALIKRALPQVPTYLVVPQSCFVSKAYMDAKAVEKINGRKRPLQLIVDFTKDYLEALGIKLFLSPPRNLKYLFKRVRKRTTAIDLDVDYMEEFQSTCYTNAPRLVLENEDLTKLGSLDDIMKVVNKINPNLILISELTLSQIEHPESSFSRLIKFLENRGYEIEFGEITDSDKMAQEAIRKAEEFSETILPAIQKKRLFIKNEENFKTLDHEAARLSRNSFKIPNLL